MKANGFGKEVGIWINGDPKRFALMVKEAPIGASTLRGIIAGSYNAGPRLEKAVRGVMTARPLQCLEKSAG